MAVKEMARILRPGGLMLIYVWAMEQSKRKFTEQDVLVPWHLKPCYHGDSNAAATGENHKPKKNRKGRKKKQKSSTATSHSHDRQSSADTTNEQSLADTNTLYDGQSLGYHHWVLQCTSSFRWFYCLGT
jgi:tRNA (uracil-5-)-methyltransferase TRM9